MSSWSPHTALPCTAGGRQKSVAHLTTCFSDLIWLGLLFFQKLHPSMCLLRKEGWFSCRLFDTKTWEQHKDTVIFSKHLQFNCNVGKNPLFILKQFKISILNNVVKVWLGCRVLVQAGSQGFMASTWNFCLNRRSQGPDGSVPFQSTTHRVWGQLKKIHFLIYVH